MDEVESILNLATERIEAAKSLEELEKIRVSFLGKNGAITSSMKKIPALDPKDKALFGKRLNEAKLKIESLLSDKIAELKVSETNKKMIENSLDLTIPGPMRTIGKVHPITRTIDECVRIFSKMGFDVVEGPEMESVYYNFEALNTPQWHPARDLQDTFYISDELLLRTQTSPVQIRTMERRKPPLRIISPGRVYRNDYDATHLPSFFQIEGLAIDKEISIADLKGTLESAIKALLGEDKVIRFRPHYFPFTEPSVEVDVSFSGKKEWLEILGAGMVHPNVLRNVGLDPDEWQGFAFGMGMERIAMLKYGINDIREFPRNSLNFLGLF
uniref:Phenylalanine--tRNA ligase alpha subunit n=1 Tax=Mesoaciditoga lauensis TaxID=1495039 RepID=A0A7V3RFJ8_9BACT